VFCEVDGTALAAGPAAANASTCGACGASGTDPGDGYCNSCGHRMTQEAAPAPRSVSSTLGELTVLRVHRPAELVVRDSSGHKWLLVHGDAGDLEGEALARAALRQESAFPSLRLREQSDRLGSFLLFDVDLDELTPLADNPSFAFDGALAVTRSVLDLAASLEAARFSWAPVPTDLFTAKSGELVAIRVRGAARLAGDDPFNAKPTLEALAPALLPSPLALGTPALVRLFLPSTNFSSAPHVAIAIAREELRRAESVVHARDEAKVAELCDPGLRRNHNEDATATARGELGGEPWYVLVVCDGVSSSTNADQASGIASKVAADCLAHFARSGDLVHEGAASAMAAAIRAAHVSVCTSAIEYGDGPPPGTTIVAALVFRRSLTVGWVGDSRAYWVGDSGAEVCTTDHSWVNEAIASGKMTESEAMESPLAHALTRCLGPLDADDSTIVDVVPDVRTKALPGAGHLILCSDGLWNYFSGAPAIASLVRGAGKDVSAGAIARFLVASALTQGGGDNVSVAVLTFP
jgi:PPM family protein phosphatase